ARHAADARAGCPVGAAFAQHGAPARASRGTVRRETCGPCTDDGDFHLDRVHGLIVVQVHLPLHGGTARASDRPLPLATASCGLARPALDRLEPAYPLA